MSMTGNNPLTEFHWTPQPEADRLIHEIVDGLADRSRAIADLRERMREDTGARLIDWTDSLLLPDSTELRRRLESSSFKPASKDVETRFGISTLLEHPGGIFPRIGLCSGSKSRLLFKVESVSDFAAVWGIAGDRIEGEPLSPLRFAQVGKDGNVELWAVERHGDRGFELPTPDRGRSMAMLRHQEAFRSRRRHFADDGEGFSHTRQLIDRAVAEVGVDLACDLFFAAEREYWQRRNRAARFQKARQDCLGLGWANHDHHTYRSSREYFVQLIDLLTRLGCECRERFYAGKDAGWGAQVLEQKQAGIVVFADVDLSPEEVLLDFAHESLTPRTKLSTAGLWCALHGEAVLQAGMHHLECQFDFDELKKQMESVAGIKVMPPFTNLPYLRQAFAESEHWPVLETRLRKALSADCITEQQADQFRRHGAIGSHLENLQRDEGFKGFNQKGVSDIMHRTDPRRQSVSQQGA